MTPSAHQLTVAEFLTWEEAQPERHEFVCGEIFAMGGGSARQNRVILNLASLLGDQMYGSKCQVFAQSMKVTTDEGVLYPSVIVTCGKEEAGDEQTLNAPTLIIEVLSPNSTGYDRRDKFILYRSLPSLREYALINSSKREVEVFTLENDGAWALTDQTMANLLTLASIDCKLPMRSVFRGVESGAQ